MNNMLLENCYILGLTLSFVNFLLASVGNQTATVIFAGDISFDGPVKYFTEVERSCNYSLPFEKIRNFLAQGDLRVGNLESPLVQACKPKNIGFGGKFAHHCGEVKSVEGLKYAGFDLLQLANNHFADYGNKGMKSTMKTLKDAGIDFVGVTKNDKANEGQKPVIKTINGIKIGFLAYCQDVEGCEMQQNLYKYGPAVYDRQRAKKDMKRLRKSADIIIVLMHWGIEYFPVPSTGLRLIARSLQLFGADLIIGSHPHVMQGHECLLKTMVVYSLGNFLFPKKGIDSISRFLSGRTPSKADVKEYLKENKEVFNPTELSYMFKVEFTRNGISNADYLQLDIVNDPTTNCLQPTPITNHWAKFCNRNDLYCHDFDVLHLLTPLNELSPNPDKNSNCLLKPSERD